MWANSVFRLWLRLQQFKLYILALMNIIETLLNLYYLYSQHVLSSPSAPLVGFASAVMTLSKTILYWAQEYYCGGCAIGHNDLNTLFWFWIIPNGYAFTRISKTWWGSCNWLLLVVFQTLDSYPFFYYLRACEGSYPFIGHSEKGCSI